MMSNTRDRAAAPTSFLAAATQPDGSLVATELTTRRADVIEFLQTGRVISGGLTATFVDSDGRVTAKEATIGGEVSMGKLFVRGDVTATGELACR
jgi:hypothetical protein